jgi:hypothetical protein
MVLRDVFKAHHESIAKDHGDSLTSALLWLYGPALATFGALVAMLALRPQWATPAEGFATSLAGGLALFAGVMFGLAVTLLDKAMDLDLSAPQPSSATTTAALRLQALSANSLTVAVLAGAATAALLVGSLIVALACVMHVAATATVVAIGSSSIEIVKRVWAETRERSNRARTGVSARDHGRR